MTSGTLDPLKQPHRLFRRVCERREPRDLSHSQFCSHMGLLAAQEA